MTDEKVVAAAWETFDILSKIMSPSEMAMTATFLVAWTAFAGADDKRAEALIDKIAADAKLIHGRDLSKFKRQQH